tara:strand:- start:188 stop:403 length:216 start_codon:yes stop_codon:yes gene_type:complete
LRISAKEAGDSRFLGGKIPNSQHDYHFTNTSTPMRSLLKGEIPETGFTPDIYEMVVIHVLETGEIFMTFGI